MILPFCRMRLQDKDAEILAAYFATYDFARNLKHDEDKTVDFEKGKTMNPWILNKRLKSL